MTISRGMSKALIYERAVSIVLLHEGGGRFHWDGYDPGGPTKHGISMRFAGSIGLDTDGDGETTNADIEALTRRDAVGIYEKHFWRPLRCPDLDDAGLALMVFDGGVNQGTAAIAKILQEAAGADPDGKIGPKTIAAVEQWGDHYPALIDEVAARRALRYARTRNFKRYGLGWMRRLMDVHRKAVTPWRP